MRTFNFQLSTNIVFGPGVISGIGGEAEACGKRALLVYGRQSIKRNGVYAAITASLREHGIHWEEHPGVSPNPLLSHAFKGAMLAKEMGADLIIAAGGGSVIDAAKAVALGFYVDSEEQLWKFYTREAVPQNALPVIAVQTMPATSSETNEATVITNGSTGEKFSVRTPLLRPKAAFLDPEVTLSIPADHTAYGSVDIMAHLLEGFFSNTADWSPVQDNFALGMAAAVKQSLDRLMVNLQDLDARAAVMWAGALAWNGLGASGWEGAGVPCHILEHPLSGLFDVTHAAGLTITIPAFLKVRRKALEPRILRFGKMVLGLDAADADEVIGELERWYRQLGCPARFSDLTSIGTVDIDLLVEEAMKLKTMWNASDMSEQEMRDAYGLMIEY